MIIPILYISDKSDGHCGLLHPKNRKKFFDKVKVSENNVVSMHLTHTLNVVLVDKKDGGRLFEDTDALITNTINLFLALPVGDCPPILFYDPIKNVIAAAHAGWRGLDSGILKATVNRMKRGFGVNPKDLSVYVGAHICQKHFEVKSDVYPKFSSYIGVLKNNNNKIFLDLGKVVTKQLEAMGIQGKNIKLDDRCTFEDKDFYSYRAGDEGRNLYLFGLRQLDT